MKDELSKVSIPILRRMPTYHHLLKALMDEGVTTVSSTFISEALKIDSITVRKDLAMTGVAGKPKIGFFVPKLIKSIEEFLGWNNLGDAVIAGCGSLGSALMRNKRFEEFGFQLVAGFDIDDALTGSLIGGRKVFHIDKMSDLIKRLHIRIGIIAVPENAAQDVADIMVEAGIKGIWNFAAFAIKVPDEVIVQQENLLGSLGILIKKVNAFSRI